MTIVDEHRLSAAALSAGSPRLEVRGVRHHSFGPILTPAALDFVAELEIRFGARRSELLARRAQPRSGPFGFRSDTEFIRADRSWQVAPPGPGLVDRRCEITAPPSRGWTARALTSGAQTWMADFEDATAPTWFNVIGGQRNLYDAIRGQLHPIDSDGRRPEPGDQTATILVRPRGWHLAEEHLRSFGRPVTAAFVDFGLYFFHNAQALIAAGRGPYFYLPKLESAEEARLWRDVFDWAEREVGIDHGTIRAACLIETFPAAFQMTEILFELREYSAGLNAGRWDYLFSMIKSFPDDPGRVLPDRDEITMTVPFLRAYTDLLVKTCHERGAHAIGGIAAFVPGRDPQIGDQAIERTRTDKQREAADGFDGSWVAHPGLVQTCIEVFDAELGERPHQIDRRRDDVEVSAADLADLNDLPGGITLPGLRRNIRFSLTYLRAWVAARGSVAVEDLIEDAATMEISRMQIWQWIRHRVTTTDGTEITRELVSQIIAGETLRALDDRHWASHWAVEAARDILVHGCLGDRFPEFVTAYGYERYLADGIQQR